MMNTQSVIYECDERGVATLTLNRPQKHNAFDEQLISELTQWFERIEQDEKVRVLILASTGKSFCAGADLNWMQRMADYSYAQNHQDATALATMLDKLNGLNKPTIARVQGSAFGGGIGLIACCDMAIGTRLSKFCLSEVKIGLIPATISPYVIQAIGVRQARRYFLSAEVFSARRARRLGLLHEAVSEQELDDSIEKTVNHLLVNSPQAMHAAKRLIAGVAERPIEESMLAMTSERIADIRVSPQGQEGLQAFLQKRQPDWIKE
jgi:methylglutaconyl-CoA hydratase